MKSGGLSQADRLRMRYSSQLKKPKSKLILINIILDKEKILLKRPV